MGAFLSKKIVSNNLSDQVYARGTLGSLKLDCSLILIFYLKLRNQATNTLQLSKSHKFSPSASFIGWFLFYKNNKNLIYCLKVHK